MNATLKIHGNPISSRLTSTLTERLGGEWVVGSKPLTLGAEQETDFVRLTSDYARMIDSEQSQSTAYQPGKEEAEAQAKATAQATATFQQTRAAVGTPLVEQLKEGLLFAREGLMPEFPDVKLQPSGMRDFGDGILAFNMGFTFPVGDGSFAVSNRGLLVFDTTPNQDGATAVWTRRANGLDD
jgi:hypothetical protein